VKKNGGPDRRFTNNRQFPVMRYGLLALASSSGLKALFLCSNAEALERFETMFSHSGAELPPKSSP
jgi:hypothetical protein